MKYSNTTIRELSAKYGRILKKCALFNAVVFVGIAFSTSSIAGADLSLHEELQTKDNVTVTENIEGIGVFLKKSATIDFAGHTYTGYDSSVGSTGTQSQLFHIENKGITGDRYEVILKNGTLNVLPTAPDDAKNFNFKMGVQNYVDLTLDNMVLDGSNLIGENTYTLSNNNGHTTIRNSTIIGKSDGIAFDVYHYASNGYTDGVSVKLDGGNTILGKVEIDTQGKEASKAVLTMNGKNTVTGDIVNKGGTINIAGDLTLDGSISGTGVLTFDPASSLTTQLKDDVIAADTIKTNGAKLNLSIENGTTDGTYDFAKGSMDKAFSIGSNALYRIDMTDEGQITVAKKDSAQVVETLSEAGVGSNEATAIAAIAGIKTTGNHATDAVLSEITTAIQNGDTAKANSIVSELNPVDTPTVQSVATNNVVLGAVTSRMSNVASKIAVGRSGGDASASKLSPWFQGLYAKTHNSQNAGFDAYSQGFAFGADTELNKDWTVGIGYAYTATDIKTAARKTNVYGDNYFAYAQYKPSNWYINAVLNYGHANYKEKGSLNSKYNVDTYGVQALAGYEWNILDNYAGVRYTYIDTEKYNNGITEIDTKNAQVATAVIGTKINKEFTVNKDIVFKPEFRLAGTYDFKSDNSSANITIVGTPVTYSTNAKRLSRAAIETGVGVTATIQNLELSLNYDASFRSENSTQSGIFKVKYNF